MSIRFRYVLAALCTLVLLSACGMRFYYRQLDWVIPWYLDDYISLDFKQSGVLEQRLDQVLDWHCKTQLPDYANWLREFKHDADDGFDAGELAQHYARIDGFWTALMQELSPGVAQVMADASDAQVEELFSHLDKRRLKKEQNHHQVSEQARAEQNVKRMRKQLKPWIGETLTAQQERLIDTWSHQLKPIGEQWIVLRRDWQNAFRASMQIRADRATFDKTVEALLVNPQQRWGEAYRARIEYNKQLSFAMLAELSRQLTKTQKNHLRAYTQGLIRDFDKMSCR